MPDNAEFREARHHEYFESDTSSFWMRADNGDFLWLDGSLLAFPEEIRAIIALLNDEMFPPFGAILLIIAACRESWKEHASKFTPGDHCLVPYPSSSRRLKGNTATLLEKVRDGLNRIHSLPPELRDSPSAKSEIISQFPRARHHSRDNLTQSELLRVFDAISPDDPLFRADSNSIVERTTLEALVWLKVSFSGVDFDALELRLRTGLEYLPQATPIDVSCREETKALLSAIEQDAELGGIARLARQLLGLVHLPRPLNEDEELPMGGVSDVVNRGHLDRLLLSELAHDDLTLSVRIAMNEALYFRREPLPRRPSPERLLLVDAGILMWGIPRLFATSISLAFAATTDKHISIRAYRSDGFDISPIDLRTRAGLVSHLEQVAPHLNLGDALPRFAKECAESSPNPEAIIIVHEETWNDPEFKRTFRSNDIPKCYIATVNREGTFNLLSYTSQSIKAIRTATLDLKDLFQQQKTRRTLVDPKRHHDLPAIFYVEPFPLLLPHRFSQQNAWIVRKEPLSPNYLFSISFDRRLMAWKSKECAAQQISIDIPGSKLVWASSLPDVDDCVRAVVSSHKGKRLSVLIIDTERLCCQHFPLEFNNDVIHTVTGRDEFLFAISVRRIYVFHANNGSLIAYKDIDSDHRHVHGRFFRSTHDSGLDWWAASSDGTTVEVIKIPLGKISAGDVLAVLDIEQSDGPLVLTRDAKIYNTATEEMQSLKNHYWIPSHPIALSRNGRRILIPTKLEGPRLVDVLSRSDITSAEWSKEHSRVDIEGVLDFGAIARNTRHKFQFISSSTESELIISNDSMNWWILTLVDDRICLRRNDPDKRLSPLTSPIRFVSTTFDRRAGFRVWQASWADGSKAWIDSRGLLHLRSSEKSIPECTLVLDGTLVSGWIADGRRFGEHYYLGVEPNISASELIDTVIKPFVSNLPC